VLLVIKQSSEKLTLIQRNVYKNIQELELNFRMFAEKVSKTVFDIRLAKENLRIYCSINSINERYLPILFCFLFGFI